MAITDIPILSKLKTRLDWTQERQRVLAENVANSDTPNYRAKDLAPVKFDERLAATQVSLVQTSDKHIGGAGQGGSSQFRSQVQGKYETRPAGNAVNLEDEMMKVAQNQMDYQTATALYSRSLGLIKTALGKR